VLTSDANGVGSWGALPGLTLPFSGSANLSAAGGCVFTITCTGLAPAICGNNTATSGTTCGVVGTANSPNGRGVCGNGATGVQGTSTTANGTGVAGYASGGSDAWGVSGETVTGQAVIGRAGTAPPGGGFPGGTGVVGFSNVPGAFGMWAQVTDGNAVGLTASNISNTGPGYGLRSFSSSSSNGAASIGGIQVSPTGNTVGVYGEASSNSGWGVYGNATATSGNANGVWGNSVSPNGTGVIGANTASSGLAAGVHGFSSSTTGGAGVVGSNYMPSGTTYGVYGESDSTSGTGVFGNVTAASGYTHGVTGYTSSDYGAGVFGNAWATTGPATGVTGISYSSGGYGVYGLTYDTSGVTYAIYGQSNGNPNGWAGYFSGNVNVTGTLSKGFGTFKIDHPLDPENKYLYHSFVESPDMKNIYDGVVTTDARGYATVTMPAWFDALNREFRYQLTVIDAANSDTFVQAKIVQELAGNQFSVRTSSPNTKVSWQVTGIRQDALANARRVQVEVDKPESERGLYLYPQEHGQPVERGIDYQRALRDHTRAPASPEPLLSGVTGREATER
jgi:hypothetical protein